MLPVTLRRVENRICPISRSCTSSQQKAYEGHAKDYEFSGTSMREHCQSGYEDTRRTLKRQEWLAMPTPGTGIVVHDVHRQQD